MPCSRSVVGLVLHPADTAAAPGIVHQYVECAVLGNGCRNGVFDLLAFGHVGRDKQASDVVGDGCARVGVEFGDDHLRALVGEPAGDAVADARARASDQSDFAVQGAAHGSSPSTPVVIRSKASPLAVEWPGDAADDLPAGATRRSRKWYAPARARDSHRRALRTRMVDSHTALGGVAVDGDDGGAEEVAASPGDQPWCASEPTMASTSARL